jgi:hypothetical protein
MSNRGQIIIGVGLVLFGAGLLLANILHINFWAICWPVGLIVVGVLMLWRPPFMSEWHFAGNILRSGAWQVQNEDIWLFAGDVKFDLRQAVIPPGETVLRVTAFAGDVDLIAPRDVGVTVAASGFVVNARLGAEKLERFVSTAALETPDYAVAERKLRLIALHFAGDVDVVQA